MTELTYEDARRNQLHRGLRGLDDGSARLAARLGVEREGVAETLSQVQLTPDVVEVSDALPTASERIRAARIEQERPTLAPLDAAAPAPELDNSLDGPGHSR